MLRRFVQVGRLANSMLARQPSYPMSDKWKEREQTAENMYISQKEKDLLKKLLQRAKAEKEEEGEEEEQVISPKKKDKVDDKEFERRLKKIFKDHGHNGQGHLVPPKDQLVKELVQIRYKFQNQV